MSATDSAYRDQLQRQQASESDAKQLEGYRVWFDGAVFSGVAPALDYGAGRGQGVRYLPLEQLDVLDPETMRPVPRDGPWAKSASSVAVYARSAARRTKPSMATVPSARVSFTWWRPAPTGTERKKHER